MWGRGGATCGAGHRKVVVGGGRGGRPAAAGRATRRRAHAHRGKVDPAGVSPVPLRQRKAPISGSAQRRRTRPCAS